jgi:transcriptional regulator with XRE-family HTH domain
MIPKPSPLQNKDLQATVCPVAAETLTERARRRIRDEMTRLHLSQRDVAGICAWSQSRVSKLLNGRVEMGLEDLAGLCFAVSLKPTEVVRDQGLEFCAELTPIELRFLEHLRQLPTPTTDSLMQILGIKSPQQTRRASAPKKKRARL